ncbi:MAG: hypothetical protein KF812_05135 [Fimbriimonadaceae bacterium]|nr:hypothetical protein [Fimbriimonadaceae bacterium]
MSYTQPPGSPPPNSGYFAPPPQKRTSQWPWIIGIVAITCIVTGVAGVLVFNRLNHQVNNGPQVIYEERVQTHKEPDRSGFGTYAMENLGVRMDLPAKPVPVELDSLGFGQKMTYAKAGVVESDDPDLPYTVYVYGVEYFPLMVPDDIAEVGDNFVEWFEDYEDISITSVQRTSFPTEQFKGQRVDITMRWAGETTRVIGWGGWRGKQGAFFYIVGPPDQEKLMQDDFYRMAESMFFLTPVPPSAPTP